MSIVSRRQFLNLSVVSAVSLFLTGCSFIHNTSETIVVYSCLDGKANEILSSGLKKQFPQYQILVYYISTGNCAARLQLEGSKSEADIVVALEGGYMRLITESLDELEWMDNSRYCSDLVDQNKKAFPFERVSSCIACNIAQLEKHGLPVPQSYQDLLNPIYEGLIVMPSPKASGTGYNFLKSLINAWGEEEAFNYFDSLSKNVYQFTSSGSGPVNALVQGEAAVGFCMTYQVVEEINNGSPLEIFIYDEGSPWDVYSSGIISGRSTRRAVREVFEWIETEGVKNDNLSRVPDKVLVDVDPQIPNYPTQICYADMHGIDDINEKERILSKWKY